MTKKVFSIILTLFILLNVIPVSAIGNTSASSGGASSGNGYVMTGRINLPSGYVYNGRERLDIYISTDYDSYGYEEYTSASLKNDGTYEAYIPEGLSGSYAVSAYMANLSGPVLSGNYNCDNNALIAFGGKNVTGVNFTPEVGYTISGRIKLGEDAILQDGILYGFIGAYKYEGELLDMEMIGEGNYSCEIDRETGSFDYELAVPKNAGEIVLAVRVGTEAADSGNFKSNILNEYVYYGGENSSLDYKNAKVINVSGNVSDIDIELFTGAGFSWFAKLPEEASGYSEYAYIYIEDKETGDVIVNRSSYIYQGGYWENIVLPKEYLNKQVYFYYDLYYNDDVLYTDLLYVNPDGSFAKTREEAVPHTLTGTNAVSFTAAPKTDFSSSIKGKITFESGCSLNGYFYCTIIAENTVTENREYAYVNKSSIGEYNYVLTLPEDGNYIVWADIECYDSNCNISQCEHYYTSAGMVYNRDNAEIIDTTIKNSGIDFEFKKTKSFKGKVSVDGEFLYKDQFKAQFYIESEDGSYWQDITLNDDLTFDIKLPVNIQGNCSAYLEVSEGSDIVPGYYYADEEFNPETAEVVEFNVSVGRLIKGKIKLPEGVDTANRKSFTISLATINSGGYINVRQNYQARIESGSTEAEFLFSIPEDDGEEYIIYGSCSGSVSGLYNDKFYYCGTTSSINKENAVSVTAGTENIVFYAMKGKTLPVNIINPVGSEYADGSITIDFGDFKVNRYFYLDSGETYNGSIVLSEEHIGLQAYVSYRLNQYYNTNIYVNPDGTVTNNKKEAVPHTIADGMSLNVTISNDEELFKTASIKGTLSISETAFLAYSDGSDASLDGYVYLYKDGYIDVSRYIYVNKNTPATFEFDTGEVNDYILAVYLDNWSYQTNLVCNKYMYYTGNGWSESIDDAIVLNNSTEQNIDIALPELDAISGKVEFAEGTYLDNEIRYEITYTSVSTSESTVKSGYINSTDDFEYKIVGIDEVDDYYVSIRFGSYYSQSYDTNIPYGKTYYYTENGLTADETAERKVVNKSDSILLKMPVNPSITGTVKFPEGAEFSGNAGVYIYLYDENGYQICYREYQRNNTEDFQFAISGSEDTEKYSVAVHFNGYGVESNIENGALYYTKEGMTSDTNNKKYYTLAELSGIELKLRQKRYITGKLIAEGLVNYDDTLTARVEFQTDRMWTYRDVTFDNDLSYRLEIPSDVDGEFYVGFEFGEEQKNNIVKDEYYYYSDGNGEKKKVSSANFENINIEPEVGYIFSGVVKLPQNAVIYENQNISGTVYFGSEYKSSFEIPYGKREGGFFMVVPKSGYTGTLYTSSGYGFSGKSENLYAGQVYYKDKETSVVSADKAEKIRVNKDTDDAVIMLITGEVYSVTFTKPENVTTSENVTLYAETDTVTFSASATITETSAKASIVFPSDYNGKDLYLYYDMYYDNNNSLYKENVYIGKDGSLTGARKIADTFKIGEGGTNISVTLAENDDIEFPEYVYRSPYPYRDYEENTFSYEYTEGDCDFLRVTFANETYFASPYYSARDALYITCGDGSTMGPYYTNSLSGKTLNIPGKSFTAYIAKSSDASAFGFAVESIEPKNYTVETAHPYMSAVETTYPYTHGTQAEGLRLYFSEDTDFSERCEITYTKDGESRTAYYYSYSIAGNYVDVRGNSFVITVPADTSGSHFGFAIVDIEELEYCNLTFKNYDGTVLYETEVVKGGSAYYNGATPEKERDEDYIYTFDGWDKSLENIQDDMVLTAQFTGNDYAVVQFKNSEDAEDVLYTDYVIIGERAYYDGEEEPSKPSTNTKAYIFDGWSRSLSNIKEDTVIYAEFEECDILVQSAHPYSTGDVKTYTYEGSADSIILFFSSDSKLNDNDEIIIYDEEDRVQHYISGNFSSEGYTVPGKTAKIHIVGNGGGEYGYALAKAEPMWHDFSDWYQYYEPTCTDEGFEYRYCYNCYTEEEREILPLGHSFGNWQEDADGTVYKECGRCFEREYFTGDISRLGIVNIKVVDAIDLQPLEDVTLTAYDENGNETVWYTDTNGCASPMLSRGTNNLVVYSEGYMIRNISVEVSAGVTDVPVIGLTEKPAVQCKLEAKIMDKDEIEAAGIDTSDPLNSHVYKYKINVGFGEKTVYFNKEGGYIETGDGRLQIRDEDTGTTATIHPVNDRYYLIIYGQTKWLKEMFDVELVALNTSSTDTAESVVAEIKVPDGMSLASMNTGAQSDVQRMGSLKSGESKSVHWYLRGDAEGEYNISAKLTGVMMPFGEQFGYEYTTDEPVKVYAGSALRMNIVVPASATYGEDYTVKLEIENVSDRSVYNLSNSIDKVLQSKFLRVDKDGYEKYFEENALGYIAVDELKPGEKIVAEIKSNILFESSAIKDKISSLADSLKDETDVLALFNSVKGTLDLFNDNYDIIYNALGNVTRAKVHLSGEKLSAAESLETVLTDCVELIKSGASSRAMYFINCLKQENTSEELAKLSKDSNFYTVWTTEKINKISSEINYLYAEAINPENCGDYDVYGDIKSILKAVPANFWFDKLFVTTLEGSTTSIPYSFKVVSAGESYTGVTNISNYYYNIFSKAIDRLSQPWYTQADIRDIEGVTAVNEIIKMDAEKTLTFAVTDVSGDTRFNAWVEGEDGKHFAISSTAEGEEATESGITFVGPAYLSVSTEGTGKGTLYVEKVSEISTFSLRPDVYSFEIEALDSHVCSSENWVEVVTPYDNKDGFEAKYCDTCNTLVDIRTVTAENPGYSGSYVIAEETVTSEGYSCKLTFNEEAPIRSAVAIVVFKNNAENTIITGTDKIKVKPMTTVEVNIPLKDVENLQPRLLLWDNIAGLKPVGR